MTVTKQRQATSAGAPSGAPRAVGYRRISKDANGNGHSLEAQTTAIEQACEARGWKLLRVEEDVQSGGSTKKRPGLERALAALDSGEADYLIAAKLDRLSRSVSDFADMLKRHPQKLAVLDLGFDLTSPYGEAMAHFVSVMAQLERRLISERTKVALTQAKTSGKRLGNPRPARTPKRIENRIARMRKRGLTLREIAEQLNIDGILTTRGNSWSPETVRLVLQRVT